MPFGLRNSAQTFQRFINEALRDLPFAFVYVDDALVASSSEHEHRQLLRLIFERLSKFGVFINVSKCVFGVQSQVFLGHRVDVSGCHPIDAKVSTISDCPTPTSFQQLRRFIGLVNFYRRFIPHCVQLMLPLTNLFRGNNREFSFPDTAVEAFNRASKALADPTALVHPIPDAPLSIVADASNFSIGAALQQQTPTGTQPLAFYSAKLTPPQTRYSTFGRELLAIYLAINIAPTFDFLKAFIIKLLTVFLGRINAITRPSIYLERIAELQNQPTFTESLQHTSLQLEAIPLSTTSGTILCDLSRGASRPVVPSEMRRDVFVALHNLAHPGIRTTQRLVSERFVWPSMNTDIRQWTRLCLACQKAKVGRHNKVTIGTFLAPDARFAHVHIDLVGPFSTSRGCIYLLTAIDRFTRRPISTPIPNITADSVAHAFLEHWISHYGGPSIITTDRGQQFESRLFNNLTDLLGCSRTRTTAYHPSPNGLVERFHWQINASLRTHDNPSHWSEHLPLVMLGIRTALKPDLECSAAELVYGTTPRIPGDFFGHSQSSADLDPNDYVQRLRHAMTHLRATPPRPPTTWSRNSTIANDNKVFLIDDTDKSELFNAFSAKHLAAESEPLTFSRSLADRTLVTIHITTDLIKKHPDGLDTKGQPGILEQTAVGGDGQQFARLWGDLDLQIRISETQLGKASVTIQQSEKISLNRQWIAVWRQRGSETGGEVSTNANQAIGLLNHTIGAAQSE
ncbi:hypothetical protein SprV_0501762100 [Sparganum proliferum]